MSNSFNISVKPEIAALETKVDTIDTVVDAIRATDVVNLSSGIAAVDTVVDAIRATDVVNLSSGIAAIDTVVDANKVVIDDIHDTDLPAVKTVVDVNSTNIGHIRNVAIPNVITEIDANETKIDNAKNVIDDIYANQPFLVEASDTLLASADTERWDFSDTWIKKKDIYVFFTGIYRVFFEMKSSDTQTNQARIYINGIAYGTLRSTASTSYVQFSEDLLFNFGDSIQLYIKSTNAKTVTVRYFRVYGDKGTAALSAFVIQD